MKPRHAVLQQNPGFTSLKKQEWKKQDFGMQDKLGTVPPSVSSNVFPEYRFLKRKKEHLQKHYVE